MDTRGHLERRGIIEALLAGKEETGPGLMIRNPKWIVGTGRWEAVCSYDCETKLHLAGHATDVLKIVDGTWQIIFRHESHPPGDRA